MGAPISESYSIIFYLQYFRMELLNVDQVQYLISQCIYIL